MKSDRPNFTLQLITGKDLAAPLGESKIRGFHLDFKEVVRRPMAPDPITQKTKDHRGPPRKLTRP